jgi:hypothetical protein
MEAYNARYRHIGSRAKDSPDEEIWLPNGGGEGCPTINRMHSSVMNVLSDDPSLESIFSEVESGLPRFTLADERGALNESHPATDPLFQDEMVPDELLSVVRTIAGDVPGHLIAEEISSDFAGLFTAQQIAAAIRIAGV